MSNHNPAPSTGYCGFCGLDGHWEEDCTLYANHKAGGIVDVLFGVIKEGERSPHPIFDESEGWKAREHVKECGGRIVEYRAALAQPAPVQQDAPTERENDLIRRIRAQCDHAGINDMRLPPRFGQIEGVVAVPELNIDAAIEGWKRSHGLPVQQDAPAPSMVGDAKGGA